MYFIADDYTYLPLMMIIVVAFQQKSYFSFKKKVLIAYTSVVKVDVRTYYVKFICDVLHFAMMWRLRDDCPKAMLTTKNKGFLMLESRIIQTGLYKSVFLISKKWKEILNYLPQ